MASVDRESIVKEHALEERLGKRLTALLSKSFHAVSLGTNAFDNASVCGLLALLRKAQSAERDAGRRVELRSAAGGLEGYFRHADPDEPESNDCRILLELSDDRLVAYLTLIPPRGDGNIPTINTIRDRLDESRIIHGLDDEAIARCLKIAREESDIAWRVVIARGDRPVPPSARKVKFTSSFIDKTLLRRKPAILTPALAGLWQPVEKGQRVGFLMDPQPGVAGRDVCGRTVAPGAQSATTEIGDGLVVSADGKLTAGTAGYVIADELHAEILSLYVLDNPPAGSVRDFSRHGAVLVNGPLLGPGRVECDDLFVLGDCEQVSISARGDVFVAGGIEGRHEAQVEADGRIYCKSAAGVRLSAPGEIVVGDAITDSDVTSNDTIKVTSPGGMIVGGNLHALREISAGVIGSDSGVATGIAVGRDILTAPRLKVVRAGIAEHEEDLRRIETLKAEIAQSGKPLQELPIDKQGIYIDILRKEKVMRFELKALQRRKSALGAVSKDFPSACVRAVDGIYPPARIEILDAVQEIAEKMGGGTLRREDRRVVLLPGSFAGERRLI